MIFEPAVDHHEGEKHPAELGEIGDLAEFEAEKFAREMFAPDRLVDDHLRQLERVIEKREGQESDDDEIDLLAQAVAQHKAVERGVEHVGRRRGELPAEQRAPPAVLIAILRCCRRGYQREPHDRPISFITLRNAAIAGRITNGLRRPSAHLVPELSRRPRVGSDASRDFRQAARAASAALYRSGRLRCRLACTSMPGRRAPRCDPY
jgi:hypothetical protein